MAFRWNFIVWNIFLLASFAGVTINSNLRKTRNDDHHGCL